MQKKKIFGTTIPIYGVQELLKATLLLLKDQNNFDEKYFVELIKINDNIIDLKQNKNKIREKKLDEYQKEYDNIFQEIASKYQLFQKLKNNVDTIKKKREDAQSYLKWYIGGGFLSGIITIPFANVPILLVIYFYLIYHIESIFEIQPLTLFEKIRIIFGLKTKLESVTSKSGKILGGSVKTTLECASSKSGAILEGGISNVIGKGISKSQYGYLKLEGFQKLYSEVGECIGYISKPNFKGELLSETFY